MTIQTYEEALTFIHTPRHVGPRPGLLRMQRLMDLLGAPHKRVRYVHIAGTNGKGSTAAMTAQVLRHAGYRTGLFVSPFVMDFRERMQIDGEMISRQALIEVLNAVMPALDVFAQEGSPCTEFETITAMALWWFANQHCDIAVLEVGMGGRLDCTNIIDSPECCAITSISLDHTKILGDTVAAIAGEKCGILKPGTRCSVYCLLHPDALQVVKARCAALGICPNIADLQELVVSQASDAGADFVYRHEHYHISMAGEHQIYNALTAIGIMEELRTAGWCVSRAALQAGLADTGFVGRLERVTEAPLCLIDGAHNPAKIEMLCRALDAFYPHRRLFALIAMMRDKDYPFCIRAVASRCARVYATSVGLPRALTPEEVADVARTACPDVRICGTPLEAAIQARGDAQPEDVVLACGSLYMIGDAKRGFLQQAQSQVER